MSNIARRELMRQLRETEANPKVLPKSWYEPGLAERMSDWMRMFGPEAQR